MSDQDLQASCIGCKSDLTKEPHKEDCSILLKQKADFAQRELDQEKILAEQEKEKAIADARKTLEENNKKEVDKIKAELKKKHAVLAKIRKLVPTENFKDKDVLDLTLDEVFALYRHVLKTVKDEKTNGKMQYDVSCPICNELLGESSDIAGGKILQKEHKKAKHRPSVNVGGWIALGLLFTIVTAGAVGVVKLYQKRKKKDAESTE